MGGGEGGGGATRDALRGNGGGIGEAVASRQWPCTAPQARARARAFGARPSGLRLLLTVASPMPPFELALLVVDFAPHRLHLDRCRALRRLTGAQLGVAQIEPCDALPVRLSLLVELCERLRAAAVTGIQLIRRRVGGRRGRVMGRRTTGERMGVNRGGREEGGQRGGALGTDLEQLARVAREAEGGREGEGGHGWPSWAAT